MSTCKRVASRLLAQCATCERGEPTCPSGWRRTCCSSARRPRRPATAAGAAPGRGAPGLRAGRRRAGRLRRSARSAASTPRCSRRRASASPPPRKPGRRWPAARCTACSGLAEQFALVGDSLQTLYPARRAAGAGAAARGRRRRVRHGRRRRAELAMEVATAVLYLEAALEDADFDRSRAGRARAPPGRAHRRACARAAARAARSAGWRSCTAASPTARPWAAWCRNCARRCPRPRSCIDQFFRNPAEREVLIPVPASCRDARRAVGAGHGPGRAGRAAHARRRRRLIATEVEPQHAAHAGAFDRLAGNLGALGFLIDMLSVQPQLAKSLFVFDADSGTLEPGDGPRAAHAGVAAGRRGAAVEPRLIEQAQIARVSAVPSVPLDDVRATSSGCRARPRPPTSRAGRRRAQAHSALERAAARPTAGGARRSCRGAGRLRRDRDRSDAGAAAGRREPPPPRAVARAADAAGRPAWKTNEMREIFLEEAREVHAQRPRRRWPRSPSARRPRRADHAAPRLPHPQGQLAHGRAEGLRRSRLGLRAALQHPPGRRAAAPTRCSSFTGGRWTTSAPGSRRSPPAAARRSRPQRRAQAAADRCACEARRRRSPLADAGRRQPARGRVAGAGRADAPSRPTLAERVAADLPARRRPRAAGVRAAGRRARGPSRGRRHWPVVDAQVLDRPRARRRSAERADVGRPSATSTVGPDRRRPARRRRRCRRPRRPPIELIELEPPEVDSARRAAATRRAGAANRDPSWPAADAGRVRSRIDRSRPPEPEPLGRAARAERPRPTAAAGRGRPTGRRRRQVKVSARCASAFRCSTST